MNTIKISSKVEEEVWADFKSFAKLSHQNVSGLLTDAIRDYLKRKRVRPEMLDLLSESMDENDKLGHLLAK